MAYDELANALANSQKFVAELHSISPSLASWAVEEFAGGYGIMQVKAKIRAAMAVVEAGVRPLGPVENIGAFGSSDENAME